MSRTLGNAALDRILGESSKNLTLLVGNGINRFGESAHQNSWYSLLLGVAQKHIKGIGKDLPQGITATEVFDLANLAATTTSSSAALEKEFCEPMKAWRPFAHHRMIVKWAIDRRCPILTTNFDDVLSQACHAKLLRHGVSRFTDYYPWSSYYGLGEIERPSKEFGIWHVHGMVKYRRSIRLGLNHYIGAAQHLRSWMYNKGFYSSIHAVDTWRGASTWVDAIFRNDLLIVGLTLGETEIFLRWLLLERAKLYLKYPTLKRKGWYVCKADDAKEPRSLSVGRDLFLNGVGIQPLVVKDHEAIYRSPGWN